MSAHMHTPLMALFTPQHPSEAAPAVGLSAAITSCAVRCGWGAGIRVYPQGGQMVSLRGAAATPHVSLAIRRADFGRLGAVFVLTASAASVSNTVRCAAFCCLGAALTLAAPAAPVSYTERCPAFC
eukprot:6738244-Pyramimonas_sp.AAC.1